MGGKDGGGGGVSPAQMGYVVNPAAGSDPTQSYWITQDEYNTKYNAPAPAAAAAPEAPAAAAPEAAAPAAEEAPVVDNSPPKNDSLTPTIPGGSDNVGDPASPFGAGSGTVLGGAVKNPPSYWTGSASKFKSGGSRGGGTGGSLTTTQT